jgi:hypothetical protein
MAKSNIKIDNKKIYNSERWNGTPTFKVLRCGHCKHFIGYDEKLDYIKCKAFDDGIPEKYLYMSENDIKECNKGLHFEPRK